MILQYSFFLPILFVLPLILIVPSVVFLFIFFRKYLKTKQNILMYLSGLFLIFLIKNILQIGSHGSPTVNAAVINFVLFRVFDMLMIYFFVLVLEMFEENLQYSNKFTLLTILMFMAIGGYLSGPELDVRQFNTFFGTLFNVELEQALTMTTLLQFLFNFSASVFLLLSLYKSRKAAHSPKQKHLIFWLFVGLIFTVLLPAPIIIVRFMNTSPEFLIGRNLIRDIFEYTGMLILGLAFYRVVDNPWLLQRQKVHLIVVYSPSGVELFSKTFSSKLAKDDSLLLVGGFSAVTSLFKEATKTAGNVDAILLEGNELRLKNRDTFVCALLVEYTTQATELALEKFTDEFESNFKKELENFNGDVTEFRGAEKFVNKYFA